MCAYSWARTRPMLQKHCIIDNHNNQTTITRAHLNVPELDTSNTCAMIDWRASNHPNASNREKRQEKKRKATQIPQPAFALIAREEKRESWSECSIRLEASSSLSPAAADLSSQLTGESSASASASATDSPPAETLLLFDPPRSDPVVSSNSKYSTSPCSLRLNPIHHITHRRFSIATTRQKYR